MRAFKLQPLKAKYQQLAPREQNAVFYGSIFVGLFMVYQFILSPLDTHAEIARKQLTTQRALLSWMQGTDKNIQVLAGKGKSNIKSVTPVSLMSALQIQVKHDGLAEKMTELKQTSGNSVGLSFKKVDFDSLMKLTMLVLEKEKVMITQFSVKSAGALGQVDVNITFKT